MHMFVGMCARLYVHGVSECVCVCKILQDWGRSSMVEYLPNMYEPWVWTSQETTTTSTPSKFPVSPSSSTNYHLHAVHESLRTYLFIADVVIPHVSHLQSLAATIPLYEFHS